jgi:hypothetical protein
MSSKFPRAVTERGNGFECQGQKFMTDLRRNACLFAYMPPLSLA